MNVTRLEQKSFVDRWESQETALRKTPAPWSAKKNKNKTGGGDGNASTARKVSPQLTVGSRLSRCPDLFWRGEVRQAETPLKIPGGLPRSGYCASARARAMLHERRLNDSYEFQESRVSISVNRLSYTPTDTNTHVNHVCRWVGNVTAFSFSLTCVVSVCVGFGSLFVSRGVLSLPLSPSRFCAFSLAGIWSWGESDALIRACVFSKATLHVRSACALLIHILCKIRSVWCGGDGEIGGWSTWTIGVAHRDCLFSDKQRYRRMVNTETCQTSGKCQV